MPHPHWCRCAAGALVLVGATGTASGIEFELRDGAIKGRFDSVLHYGVSMRVGDPESQLTAPTNGGNQNFEDGDIVVNRITGTHDLELSFGEYYGAFFRGTYFYDQANDDSDLAVSFPVVGQIVDGGDASSHARSEVNLRDAFFYADLRGFDIPVKVRVGEQVISWGESTFIGGSLNDINTTDVTQLRTPGAELKNALLPNMATHFAWELNQSMTLEGFYLFDFDPVVLDAAGTFFNTTTFVANGGTVLPYAPTPTGFLTRLRDRHAKDSGQFGTAIRYSNPALGPGFEFAGYYMNLHSHTPFVAVPRGSASYYLAYPEDIDIYGVSMNTQIASFAIGGEYSYRRNAPVTVGGGPLLVGAALGAPTLLPVENNVAQGWDRTGLHQVQFTFQKTVIPRFIGAENGGVLAEVGYHKVDDRPALYTASDSSWGYQIRMTADYNRALFDVVNLTPLIAFRHDVNGTAGPFLDEAKSVTVGVNWSYMTNFIGGISYTTNFDGPRTRADRDRNWASISFAYEF